MLVKALRVGLGQIIVLGDALTRPRPQKRSPQGQAAVNADAAALSLYQFQACPLLREDTPRHASAQCAGCIEGCQA